MLSFKGKVSVVIGASSSIGRETAKLYVKQGLKTIIAGRNIGALKKIEEELKEEGEIRAVKCDVRKEEDINALFDLVEENYGVVDILVNNAALFQRKRLEESTYVDLKVLFETNVFGTFLSIKRAIPAMKKNQWGRIINVSSIAGISGLTNASIYSSTKAAVINLTKSIAKEVSPYGITINSVAPGVIDTGMGKDYLKYENIKEKIVERIAEHRMGKPEEVAYAIVFLSSDQASYINGSVLSIDGGCVCNLGIF